MPKGQVKWFSAEKRYGFIAQKSGEDIFVHLNDIEGGKPLAGGDVVEFDVGHGNKGPKAIHVRLVEAADGVTEPSREKPYDYVRGPSVERTPLAAEAGHEQFARGRYTGRLVYQLETLSPVFVASGRYARGEEVGLDVSIVRSHYKVGKHAAVPGSSLKGAVRAVFEAVTPSCMVTDRRQSCQAKSGKNPDLCPACAVFGAMGYLGRVSFSDAVLCESQTRLYHIQALYAPRRRDSRRKFYRHGVRRDDPNNEPIEAIPQGRRLTGHLDFKDLNAEELGALFFSLGLDGSFCLKIGGGKPACLGAVVFAPQEITVHAEGRWLDAGDGVKVYEDTDAALNFIQQQMQQSTSYLHSKAVKELRQVLRFPSNYECPTGMY